MQSFYNENLCVGRWLVFNINIRMYCVGVFSEEGTPVPISNTEVKLFCVDDTLLGKVERRQHCEYEQKHLAKVFFICVTHTKRYQPRPKH